MVEGRLEESLAVQLVFLHPGQEGLMVVAHWCCIRLHSLFMRVSCMLLCASADIEPYRDLRAVAPEPLRRARAAASPQSAEAWR